MKFKYRPFPTQSPSNEPEKYYYRPMIPLRVIGPVADWASYAFVDTGADETTLPRSAADSMGVVIDEAHPQPVTVMGGQTVLAFFGSVEFEMKQRKQVFRWRQRVGFVNFARREDEVVILGHEGFLNYFTATFNGKKRELTLRPNGIFPP